MNIYLPVEIKSRELESKLLLAFEAASRGHQVLMGPLAVVFVWGPNGLLKPGIFHDKSLHPGVNYPSQHKLTQTGSLVTSLDEESGLLDKSYEKFAKVRFSEKTMVNASKVFCWGDFDSDSLREIYPEQAGSIEKTGSPRVDLWRPGLRQVYEELTRNDTDLTEKGYIFIVSNFGLTLNQNRFWQLQHHLKRNNFFKTEEDEFRDYERYSHEMLLLREFVKMIRALSAKYPDQKIVIRPHPVENTDGWKILLGDLPNVRIIRKGSINAWVNHAGMVIHNGCTTAFEARVNGKNLIAYRPVPSEFEREIPNTISYQTYELDELLEVVNQCLSDKEYQVPYNAEADKALGYRLAMSDEDYSFVKIVNAWESLEKPGLEQANNWSYVSTRLKTSSTKKKLMSVVGKGGDQKGGPTFDISHKFPGLSIQEIHTYQQAYSKVFEHFNKVKVKKLYDRTFLFSC